ncbi:hypothetical protein Hanom_Chr14g01335181 [Helianthus anomalus]
MCSCIDLGLDLSFNLLRLFELGFGALAPSPGLLHARTHTLSVCVMLFFLVIIPFSSYPTLVPRVWLVIN